MALTLMRDQEQDGGLSRDEVSEVDPILEPLDMAGVIIPQENQRFLRRSSSYPRGDHPNSQRSRLLQLVPEWISTSHSYRSENEGGGDLFPYIAG